MNLYPNYRRELDWPRYEPWWPMIRNRARRLPGHGESPYDTVQVVTDYLKDKCGRDVDVPALTLKQVLENLPGTRTEPEETPQYVTLDMIAAFCKRSKSYFAKLKARGNNPMPSPARSGGGGKSDWWFWSEIRPWLENELGIMLPKRFPEL
jgi:hypothetical protein